MALQSEEKGTIKEICHRMFARGFSVEEVVEIRKFNKATVIFYESTYKNILIEELMTGSSMINFLKKEFSSEEMDYGSALPTYKEEDLSSAEASLIHTKKHRELKQIDYGEDRLQRDSK